MHYRAQAVRATHNTKSAAIELVDEANRQDPQVQDDAETAAENAALAIYRPRG